MTRTYQDQLGRTVEIPYPPRRIVSLVPSQTELLADLGLHREVVGITKFCIHPDAWFRSKTRVGGTKQLHLDQIDALRPDLIIGNKEENTQEQIETLSSTYPVWMSDINSLGDALGMIESIGQITGTTSEAKRLEEEIRLEMKLLPEKKEAPRALYLIWKDPYMAAGRDTFINEMMDLAGYQNALHDPSSRYPELTPQEIEVLAPDIILCSSEPFPFTGKHAAAVRNAFPGIQVEEVDGELYSWYGSRMLKALRYFRTSMHLA